MAKIPSREEINEITQGITSGSLASKLKSRSSYSLNGIGIGAILGFMVATFTGKSKLLYMIGGAAVGGAGGYLMGNKLK